MSYMNALTLAAPDATASATTSIRTSRKPDTWPKFRLAQMREREQWHFVPAFSDEKLVDMGYRLATSGRDASALSPAEQDRLAFLLASTTTSHAPDETRDENNLLARCPYYGWLPPLDIDVKGASREDALAAAKEIQMQAYLLGCGNPVLRESGGKGFHLDWAAPEGVADTLLLKAFRTLAQKIGRAACIPLISENRNKSTRPPIVLDDNILNHNPDGRGRVFWLMNSVRPSGKQKKNVAGNAWELFVPAELAVVKAALKEVHAQAAKEENPDEIEEMLMGRLHGDKPVRKKLKSIPQIQGLPPGELPSLAKMLPLFMPESGMRHEFRLATAGWLLKEGVPERQAELTVANCGDQDDGIRAVRTTAAKLTADPGANVTSRKRMMAFIGKQAMDTLHDALREDLKGCKKLDAELDVQSYLSDKERETLLKASTRAGELGFKVRASNYYAAAHCGSWEQQKECSSEICPMVEPGSRQTLVSGRMQCPHCACARAATIVEFAARYWPSEVGVRMFQFPDEGTKAAAAFQKNLLSALPVKIRTHFRCMKAPGLLAIVTDDKDAASYLGGLNGATRAAQYWGPTHKIVPILEVMATFRARRTRRFLAYGDIEALANDEWSGKVMTVSAGKKARASMPWPKEADIRLLAKNRKRRAVGQPVLATVAEMKVESAKEKISNANDDCYQCGQETCWALYDKKTGRMLGRMKGAKYTFNGVLQDHTIRKIIPFFNQGSYVSDGGTALPLLDRRL